MKVLVTGASGYIGSNLAKFLISLGYETHLIKNKNEIEKIPNAIIHNYDGNFESLDKIFKNNQINLVFHLAAFSFYSYQSEEIPRIIDSNIKFGTYLLEAMTKNGCNKIINTSTYWKYFKSQKYQPISLYSATKQAFEDIIDYYVFDHDLSAITLDLFDVYGPNDNRKKIFGLLEESIKNHKPLDMTAGKQKINMVYIDDVVQAYLRALKLIKTKSHNKFHKKYSVAGAKSYPLKEIVKKYLAIHKKNIDINWGKLPTRKNQIMTPVIGKILPNWEAVIDLSEGIRRAYGK